MGQKAEGVKCHVTYTKNDTAVCSGSDSILEDAIFWVVFALVLLILGVFPELTYWLTRKIGVMSPANPNFLVIIFLLLEKVFTLSIIVSQLEDKITVLSAETALRAHAAEKRLDVCENPKGDEIPSQEEK